MLNGELAAVATFSQEPAVPSAGAWRCQSSTSPVAFGNHASNGTDRLFELVAPSIELLLTDDAGGGVNWRAV